MLESFSSKAILTKARAMYGKQLTGADYQELLRKTSVGEIASYLKNQTHYREVLENVQETTIHRGQLEDLLRMERFSRYSRLLHYQFSKRDEVYRMLIYEAETEQILTSMRLINAQSPEQYIISLPTYLMEHTSFDLMKLARVKSFEDLLGVLRKTPYYEVVRAVAPAPGRLIDLVACETALMKFSEERMLRISHRDFSGAQRRELEKLVSIRVDIYNINTLFRIKTFFPQQDALRCCISGLPSRIPKSMRERMLASATPQQFLQEVKNTIYGAFFRDDEPYSIEGSTQRARFVRDKSQMRDSSFAPVVVAAFLSLCRTEVNNLINIIEGVRYGVPREDIEALLIVS